MIRSRILPSSVLLAALVAGACGADQDPAIEVPPTTATTSTVAPEGAGGGGDLPTVTIDNIELSGAAEVPGPGDEDGDGFANVFLEPATGEICYDINVNGIEPATAAHIHEASEDEAGPVVLPLEPPVDGAIDGCAPADAELISRIEANPSGFYINVHNEEFPEGAVRGQLA